MTKEELNKIVADHLLWLNDDPLGKRANLSRANLSSANLRDANLSYANLRDANLRDANLSSANLSRANLSRADLRYADLSYANLSRADLRSADLRSADLSSADLRGADLNGAIGNGLEMKTIQSDIWIITYTLDRMQIGCQNYSIEKWFSFDDSKIEQMENRALDWWKKWKPILKQIIEISPAKET